LIKGNWNDKMINNVVEKYFVVYFDLEDSFYILLENDKDNHNYPEEYN